MGKLISYTELDQTSKQIHSTLAKIVREKRGKMSIKQLSLIANVNFVTIKRIENGQGCSLKSVSKVCKALGLEILII